MTKDKNIALYCRVARADKIALKHQMRLLANFAMDMGYRGGKVYCDNGVSGATVDRPAFNRLNRDMLAGKIGLVVVKDLSRIARNFILTDRWLAMADALNAEVISVDGNIGGPVDMQQLRELMLRFVASSGG